MTTLIDRVQQIERKYFGGQEVFRRQSVGILLERISQLEQIAQHDEEKNRKEQSDNYKQASQGTAQERHPK